MENKEFVPRESLERIRLYWWGIVVITVLGGLAGWLFHFGQQPVYEAVAILAVNMDFEERLLTQFEQDYGFSAAGAVIGSTAVNAQIIDVAQASGIPIEPNYFAEHMFWEGKQSVWELRVRDLDPQVAADLTNIWAEAAIEALNTALGHALRADQLQLQMDSLEACFHLFTPEVSSPLLPKGCENYSLTEIQIILRNWTDEIVQEKQLSLGLLSIMKFSLTTFATVPENPALYNQASLVLAGAVIGFIVSLWVVNSIRVKPCD